VHWDWVASIRDHGYLLAFVGSVLEGETVLTLAGLAAHRGYLQLPWLIAVGALGAFIGDQVYFMAGRRFGGRLLARFPRFQPGAAKVDALLERRPSVSVLAVRFLYGLRTVGPIAIGMTAMPWHRFALFNGLGAVLWAACWACAGYLAGDVAQMFLGDLERVERWLIVGALAAAAIAVVILRLRRRMMASVQIKI